jgi:hypothetical protein
LKYQIRSFNGKPQVLTSSLLHFACAYGSPLNETVGPFGRKQTTQLRQMKPTGFAACFQVE